MTLLNFADMLADVLELDNVYAGCIDANQKCCVGVYNSKHVGIHKICIGGKSCTKTQEKKISILIHWTDNPSLAEEQAAKILDSITDIRDYTVGDFIVHFFKCNDPVPASRDERGICEYVIEATVYYERIE